MVFKTRVIRRTQVLQVSLLGIKYVMQNKRNIKRKIGRNNALYILNREEQYFDAWAGQAHRDGHYDLEPLVGLFSPGTLVTLKDINKKVTLEHSQQTQYPRWTLLRTTSHPI
jgi:hypothetical protein